MAQSDPPIHLIGNAHLDPVWLWRWQEGFAEIKATFRSALDRMQEFPEFIFTCACASYYKWVEENEPAMFAEITERVASGQWALAGGMWVQPDCNLPAGESFARHFLYSQRYFLSRFGRKALTGYNVDSFGHHAMMPQLLLQGGMRQYVFMRPGVHEQPERTQSLFLWESPDGSRVTAFRIPTAYGHLYKAENAPEFMDISRATAGGEPPEAVKLKDAMRLSEEEGVPHMNFYGVGNHGGGPTIANIRMLQTMQEKEEPGRILFSSPDRFFTDLGTRLPNLPDLPVVRGDLHHHASDCYSAHAGVKAFNRRTEQRLLAAERLSVLAGSLVGRTDLNGSVRPALLSDSGRTAGQDESEKSAGLGMPVRRSDVNESLQKAWERVMFNQFHDILGGCSIAEAYADAAEHYGEALSLGGDVLNAAAQAVSWAIDTLPEGVSGPEKTKDWAFWEQGDAGTPVVVFNTLCWPVRAPVTIGRALAGVKDDQGNPCSLQRIRGSYLNGSSKWSTIFLADLPPLGYRVYRIFRDACGMPACLPDDEKKTAFVSGNVDGTDAATKKEPMTEPKNRRAACVMDNGRLVLEIDPDTGHIARLIDKSCGRSVFREQAAVPVVVDLTECDTWAHGVQSFRKECGRFGQAEVSVVEQGPVRWKITAKSWFGSSVLVQEYQLHAGMDKVDVDVRLDWQEKHRMLKLSFPVDVRDSTATFEVPYGQVIRPADGRESPAQTWVDVTGWTDSGLYGLALLNDGKYAFDVLGQDLRMTVANGSLYADHFGERDGLGEYMDQGVQRFSYSLAPHRGSWQGSGIVRRAGECNCKPVVVVETYHQGTLPLSYSGIEVSPANVSAVVLKRAETCDGHVLRLHETEGTAARVRLRSPLLDQTWEGDVGKNEILTLYFPDDPTHEIRRMNFLEEFLDEDPNQKEEP